MEEPSRRFIVARETRYEKKNVYSRFPFHSVAGTAIKRSSFPLIGASCLAFEVTGGIPVRYYLFTRAQLHRRKIFRSRSTRVVVPPCGERLSLGWNWNSSSDELELFPISFVTFSSMLVYRSNRRNSLSSCSLLWKYRNKNLKSTM